MNYIELINNFWKVDIEYSFTGNETKLYMYLLHTSNSLGWKNPFRLSYRQIASNANLAVNTIRTARNRLKQADLIDFSDGKRGNAADVSNKTRYEIIVSKTDYHKGSLSDILTDTPPDTHSGCRPDTINKPKENRKLNNVPPVCPPDENFYEHPAGADREGFSGFRSEKEKSCAKKERHSLVLPYASEQFGLAWSKLAESEGWKGKSLPDLQEALCRLGEFEEEFSLELMMRAVTNGWKNVVFEETAGRYRRWKAAKERRPVAVRGNFASHDNGKRYEDF